MYNTCKNFAVQCMLSLEIVESKNTWHIFLLICMTIMRYIVAQQYDGYVDQNKLHRHDQCDG